MLRAMDWDDAYRNGAYIAGADDYPPRWAAAAEAFRADCEPEVVTTGPHPRQRLDLFRPPSRPDGPPPRSGPSGRAATDGPTAAGPMPGGAGRADATPPSGAAPARDRAARRDRPATADAEAALGSGAAVRGLTVFLHGGYWMAFGPRDWSHLAAGAMAQGDAVAVVGYRLAPEVGLAQILDDVRDGVAAAAEAVPGPLRLIGHSAGGHLVARLACEGVLPDALAARLDCVVSLSGLHDLRPLTFTQMAATLRLDLEAATAESPALRLPRAGVRVRAAVGADERPEFRRQTHLLAVVWSGLGAHVDEIVIPGRHHFDVVETLTDPTSEVLA